MHAAGNVIARDGAWRGRKGPGVFRIDTAFYGVARKNQFFLSNRKRQAFRNADLLTNKIDARDHLGDRMLDRKSVVEGKRVSVRVDLGVRRIIKKKRHNT